MAYSIYLNQARRSENKIHEVSLNNPVGDSDGDMMTLADTISSSGRPAYEVLGEDLAMNMITDMIAQERQQEGENYHRAFQNALATMPSSQRAAINLILERDGQSDAKPLTSYQRKVRSTALAKLKPRAKEFMILESTSSCLEQRIRAGSVLFRQLFGTWMERSQHLPDQQVEEALVNITAVDGVVIKDDTMQRPCASERDNLRTIDVWRGRETPQGMAAQVLWRKGITRAYSISANKVSRDQAIELFEQLLKLEPTFLVARIEIGNIYLLSGNVKKALSNYLTAYRKSEGNNKAWAASNTAEAYMTLYEAETEGKSRNIRFAVEYSQQGLMYPTPMRVTNAILALVKASRFAEAADILTHALAENHPRAKSESIVSHLESIHDKSLLCLWEYMAHSTKQGE